MKRTRAGRMMICMTTPIVTEILGRALPVERDDFIDEFAPLARVLALPLDRPAPAPVLSVAA